MPLVRRRLSWMIRIWLACQIAGFAIVPTALCCARPDAADAIPACCRGVGPGQTCPMHHHDDDDATCKMRSVCGPSDAALILLSGGLGVLPRPTISVTGFGPGRILLPIRSVAILRSDRPESPPPRA
jgi:hypothetical protein